MLIPLPGENFNTAGFINAQSNITLASAMNTPQISRINRELPEKLAAGITQLLKFVNELFNLPADKKFSSLQLAVLAQDIKTRYWFLKFDEIIYVLREGTAGKWGKSYSRLDTEVVHAWFQVYISTERDAAVELASYNESVAYKKQEAAPVQEVKPMPDHIQEQLAALRKQLEKDKAQEAATTAPPKHPELTHEGALEQLKDLLPTLAPKEIQGALKQAVLKQNREIVEMIETHIKETQNKAA